MPRKFLGWGSLSLALAVTPACGGTLGFVHAWNCEDGAYVVTEFRAETEDAVVFLPGATVFLPQLRSASGARYGDEAIEIWTKGDELTLRRGVGEAGVTCSRNVRASQIETSKLGGYDYWARGNEPGWTLEIGSPRIVWTTNYGETRHEVATPQPEVDKAERTTVFRTELEGVPVVFTIVGETCFDDMSGEEFPTKFRVDHGELTYRGCGQALH